MDRLLSLVLVVADAQKEPVLFLASSQTRESQSEIIILAK